MIFEKSPLFTLTWYQIKEATIWQTFLTQSCNAPEKNQCENMSIAHV